MKVMTIARKILALSILLALLAANTPALADSLAKSDFQTCCNTAYCPLHPHQGREMPRNKTDCDAPGDTATAGSSIRACDAAPYPAVGAAPFLLAAPVTIFYEATAQPAPLSFSRFAPFVASVPSTPPPRILPS